MSLAKFVRGLAGGLVLLLSSPAVSQTAAGFDPYFAAADRLDRLASQAPSGGEPPRISDPEVAEIFRDLTDRQRLFPSPQYAPEDLEEINQVANRAIGLMMLYARWGGNPSATGSAVAQLEYRNSVRYQQELTPLTSILADIMGVMVRTFSDAVEAAPGGATTQQREGAAEARRGLAEMLTGFMQIIGHDEIDAENRLALSEAVARNADTFARALTLSQRRGLIMQSQIARSRGLGPRGSAQLGRFEEALARTGCEALCAY